MIRQKDGFQGERQIVLPPVIVEMERKDPLASSLYVTDIGYYPNATNHYRARKQPIDQYVLIYCVEGSGFYVLNGKEYQVEKNQFFILPANRPHIYGAREGGSWTIYWVHFCGEHAIIYAEGIRKAIPAGGSIVEAAIHYMQENIENRITLQNVLDYVGYSQSHFSAIFKKSTGESPLAYFNKLKIEYACKLLKETDLKMNQICYKIGIEDPFYFSRLFSKAKGMSPTEYRQCK